MEVPLQTKLKDVIKTGNILGTVPRGEDIVDVASASALVVDGLKNNGVYVNPELTTAYENDPFYTGKVSYEYYSQPFIPFPIYLDKEGYPTFTRHIDFCESDLIGVLENRLVGDVWEVKLTEVFEVI